MIRLDRFQNDDFDRGASRFKEAIWILTKRLFFQSRFPWPSKLKACLLRVFGAKVGRGLVIRPRVNISFPWKLSVGDHVWIGEETLILSLSYVKIGSHVCISQRAFICTGSHDFRAETFDMKTGPIRIEDSSWIAAQAFIGRDVTIGTGSVVSAGSVVLKDVLPGTVVRGNPAEPVKQLLPE
ncbi:MAG: putative colanic acid biosynthesis acetyltransferase WcaF [Verrucomicrobiales bacterium]|jgi:putative colanic acid biosynthesis acetyltransferase WcaF